VIKHQQNFTTEFSTYLYIVCKKSWKFNVKIDFITCFQLLVQNTSFRDNTDSCTFTVISNEAVWLFINYRNLFLDEELLIKTRSSVLSTILFVFVLPMRQLHRCWSQLTPWTVSKKARFWKSKLLRPFLRCQYFNDGRIDFQ